MTTMVWSILALAVIIVLIVAGIVIWRKRTDAQVDSLHNIERQLNEIEDELKIGAERKAHTRTEPAGKGGASDDGLGDSAVQMRQDGPDERDEGGEISGSKTQETPGTFETGDSGESNPENEPSPVPENSEFETGKTDAIAIKERKAAPETAGSGDVSPDGLLSIELPDEDGLEVPEEPGEDSGEDPEETEPVIIDIADILGSRFPDEKSAEGNGGLNQTSETGNTGMQQTRASVYNTGKSGKVYTEEELELLIKE